MGPVHLTESPNGTPVDGDHRVCDAIAALPDGPSMHAWISRFALLDTRQPEFFGLLFHSMPASAFTASTYRSRGSVMACGS